MLAALATLVAMWPLSTLSISTWVRSALLLVAAVALGGGARLLGLAAGRWSSPSSSSPAPRRGHLVARAAHVRPVRAAGTLTGQAIHTIQSYSAPAPTTRGITCWWGARSALVALRWTTSR